MNVGLPGTGIGGLFYVMSIFAMVGYELVLTLRGRTSAARWRLVGVELVMLSGIVLMIAATGWALSLLIARPLYLVKVTALPLGASLATGATWLDALIATSIPILVTLSPLVVILSTVRVLSWLLNRSIGGTLTEGCEPSDPAWSDASCWGRSEPQLRELRRLSWRSHRTRV